MPDPILSVDSLVVYKSQPARVRRIGERLTLELEDGETVTVRPKDVTLLHAGPMRSWSDLDAVTGELEVAWQMLAGSTTTVSEIAELAYGALTPATVWAAWRAVHEAAYFRSTGDRVEALTEQSLAEMLAVRAARAAEKGAWEGLIARVRSASVTDQDRPALKDVEQLALGRTSSSRVVKALGREESPENAHALLLDLGIWTELDNPHPVRAGIVPESPDPSGIVASDVLAHASPARLDLTALPAFALDDAETDTPDDAISFDGQRIWVHVADPAAVIAPDSPLDLDARERASTAYLPEGKVPMVAADLVTACGLGLQEVSPALSFAMTVDEVGNLQDVEIVPTLLRVTRLSYEDADTRLEQEPFAALKPLLARVEARRLAAGAINIDLPEVDVSVSDGEVTIRPNLRLESRRLVENAMVLAGEAAARYAMTNGLAMPFATQEAPDAAVEGPGQGYSSMFARRKLMRRSQYRTAPAPHAGLGLDAYVQATSPLRRYLDLVAHQQLRAHLAGLPPLTQPQILERLGMVDAALAGVRQAESHSLRHWMMVWLRRRPGWRSRGILVDRRGRTSIFLIPELAIEAHIPGPKGLAFDAEVTLELRSVDLLRLEAQFSVVAEQGTA